jgi:hypothetical protein
MGTRRRKPLPLEGEGVEISSPACGRGMNFAASLCFAQNDALSDFCLYHSKGLWQPQGDDRDVGHEDQESEHC